MVVRLYTRVRGWACYGRVQVMIPILDLINHESVVEKATFEYEVDEKGLARGGKWKAKGIATRDVAVGEELTWTYSPITHRAKRTAMKPFTIKAYSHAHFAPCHTALTR